MKQYVVEVYYKHPQNPRFSVFKHRYKLIAWIKALWATKFGWDFFVFNVYKQEFNMDFDEFNKDLIHSGAISKADQSANERTDHQGYRSILKIAAKKQGKCARNKSVSKHYNFERIRLGRFNFV